jgi:hypothetical protein
MDAILARSRHGTELPARKQTARGGALALARLLSAVLAGLILRQREIPSEFFRYPLPQNRDNG